MQNYEEMKADEMRGTVSRSFQLVAVKDSIAPTVQDVIVRENGNSAKLEAFNFGWPFHGLRLRV